MSNNPLSENVFINGLGQTLGLRDVVSAIQVYMEQHQSARYEVVVGTDSHASNDHDAYFVSAIVVRRIGNGGIHFWMRKQESFATLRDRIWREAMLSITLAQELRSVIKDIMGDDALWEGRLEFRCIHIDVGRNGPTREFIDGIAGMVKGFGFVPVIKPYSYGASAVADRHT